MIALLDRAMRADGVSPRASPVYLLKRRTQERVFTPRIENRAGEKALSRRADELALAGVPS